MKKQTIPFSVLIATFIFSASNFSVRAQAAADLQASVSEVTDNRTTGSFFSECKVELKFTGDAAADSGSVRRVRITKAFDELNRDLTPKADDSDSSGSYSPSQRNGALKYEVKLRNPSRKASVIKILEGEAELFTPTLTNGGIVVIKDVLKMPGDPIQNATLKKYGIDLIYLTKESYEARKKEQEKQNAAGDKLGEAFGDMFKGMFGGMMASDSRNSLRFFIRDKEKRIVGLEFQDASGKALKSRGGMTSGDFRQKDFESAPPADTQATLYLAVPEAVQSHPFKIENIPLP